MEFDCRKVCKEIIMRCKYDMNFMMVSLHAKG
ncbi:hypothetical protein DFQ00_111122 [Paenibacillus barcinonensis]|uniref:Uncharacterized protein n=1 Tax=Paenibacillus barcinonensis TaxID=198119 RepID=A0A2V4VNR9_PAEBA|nr:hypothetical protein DFQ00_111122 [Paenibacillus barcinonensis]